ncbi:MAG: efflux RND transporter periplasmic adaptor subunit [Rikenellaceae bacterium]
MLKYLLLLLPLSFSSCGGGGAAVGGASHSAAIRPVKVETARSIRYVERDFAALSTPLMAVNMAFKISGQILATPVSKGELVDRGGVLASIDPRDVELQLVADRSNYEQARSSYERARRLLAHEAVSLQEVERMESSFLTAKSQYENTQEMLKETTIVAPFRALVERVFVDEYQRVQAGEAILRIVSPTTSKVEFTLPESSLAAMENPETRFKVRFDNIANVSFDAVVTEYAKSSSDASGFPVALEVDLAESEQYAISSGMSCVVTMITSQQDDRAVVLPLSSIYSPTAGGTYVWIVGGDDRVYLQRVELDELTGQSSVVVGAGVDSGARVVTAGVYQLAEGQRVKIADK